MPFLMESLLISVAFLEYSVDRGHKKSTNPEIPG
jgi:hypothetical protein